MVCLRLINAMEKVEFVKVNEQSVGWGMGGGGARVCYPALSIIWFDGSLRNTAVYVKI